MFWGYGTTQVGQAFPHDFYNLPGRRGWYKCFLSEASTSIFNTLTNTIAMNIRKIGFALLTAGAFYTTAQAQVHSIGPTVGVNCTNISETNDATSQPGLNIGIVYNYSKHENYGFGLEARYSQEGAKVDYGTVEGFTKLNYLRVPLKFQYFFGDIQNAFRPKIYAGPSLGILLGGKYKGAVGDQIVDVTLDRDDYSTFDAGLMGGVGFNYKLKEATWLNFDVAYTHGLIDITKNGDTNANRNVNVNLGIAWGF